MFANAASTTTSTTVPSHPPDSSPLSRIETEFLIVGAGPAGLTLSTALAVHHNLTGLTISNSSGPSPHPRAHYTTLATLDILRILGLYPKVLKVGTPAIELPSYRWCETLTGEEYARIWAMGQKPTRRGDWEEASPCGAVGAMDLGQDLLEPMLTKRAVDSGWKVRFSTNLISLTREEGDEGRYVCLVEDLVSDTRYEIRAKYLFGADGGRSQVVRELGLPFSSKPGGGTSFTVHVHADLERVVKNKEAFLSLIMRLGKDWPFVTFARPTRLWDHWSFTFLPQGPDVQNPERSNEEWKAIVEDLIDTPNVKVEISGVSKWHINETWAERVDDGHRAFCLGDAVHRHPPTNGLGSNTAIQEAMNLSWKVGLVARSLASPSLLSTYNTERQPYGASLAQLTNETLRNEIQTWRILGITSGTPSTLSERLAGVRELRANNEAGRKRRELLRASTKEMERQTHQLGREMGHLYDSPAVFNADEPAPLTPTGNEALDPVTHYSPCTYPGRRLPHVWLNTLTPVNSVSTVDLAGHGGFTLFLGHGGSTWRSAAAAVSGKLGVRIDVWSIGMGLDWEDPGFAWWDVRGVEDDGCVLVRPDLFVAWRAKGSSGVQDDDTGKLEKVLRAVLGLE